MGYPTGARAQEQEPSRILLRDEYENAKQEYEAAFGALEIQETRFSDAMQRLAEAQEAGDDAAVTAAFAETQRIAKERRQAIWRVEDTAEVLSTARQRLLEATRSYLEELLAQADTVTDPVAARELAGLMPDIENQITTLREEEDPPVTPEPLPEINAERNDSPVELRNKAGILEFAANQYEEQNAFLSRRLDGLRQEQSLLRRSRDFYADRVRFGDRPPGGTRDPRTEPPSQNYEERILELEALREEITESIQILRVRAADLRRLAGGEWAW